ncbi:MAG: hypothetical protein NWR72_19230 [Bacteroidia bacterium]|nr:hypothetical protein [Bacteroidia bacterium]
MKLSTFLFLICGLSLLLPLSAQTQVQLQPRVAVLYVDAVSIDSDPMALGNLLRLELQKMEKYEVVDRYDMLDMLKGDAIDLNQCYSKRCLTQAGKLLEADKVLSGSVERYGDKILITLKLLNIASGTFDQTEVSEYLNQPEHLQHMVRMSLNSLFGLPNDPNLTNTLTYYSTLTVMPTTKITNNGPRMGLAYFYGSTGDRLSAPLNQGGFDIAPFMTQFGYQQEFRYLSSGNFSALVEVIPMVSGLEQSRFLPSLVILNGFRESKTGIEFAFGPSIGLRQMARGYFDDDNKWHLQSEWGFDLGPLPYDLVKRLDSRGDYELFTRWIWAFGKTFRSGYLNIPVNAFVSYNKEDWMFGLSFGFNIQKTNSK